METLTAKDLRIGNYVYADFYNDKHIIVESICSKNEDIYNSTTGEIPLSSLNPIPLSEDWLLRSGLFTQKENTNWYDLEISKCLDISISTNTFEVSMNIRNLGWINTGILLPYVHLFQNFIFAISGSKLTITK